MFFSPGAPPIPALSCEAPARPLRPHSRTRGARPSAWQINELVSGSTYLRDPTLLLRGALRPRAALPYQLAGPHLAVGWTEAVCQPAQAAQVPLEASQLSARRVVGLTQGLAGSCLLLPECSPQRQ